MRRAPTKFLAVLTLLLATLANAPAAAEINGEPCSNLATVGWGVDYADLTLDTVTVEVLGCADGEQVGIELLTADGDVPADGPLGADVADERAVFDVSDLGVGVEPVTGIRVYLVVDGDPVQLLTIVVEQRFFNPAGNEQLGLRQTTSFTVAPGATYEVPTASGRYEDVACDEVNTTLPDDGPSGAGRFQATTSRTHVACYQQVPGGGEPGGTSPDGPEPDDPDVEEPVVLDEVLEDDVDPADRRSDQRRPNDAMPIAAGDDDGGEPSVLGRALARTGLDTTALLVIGLVLVAVGARLALHRRRMHRP